MTTEPGTGSDWAGSLVHTTLPPIASSPGAARRFLAGLLVGKVDPDRSATAELLASELVTNAAEHARTPIEVSAALEDGVLRVGVSDENARLPHPSRVRPDADRGRGLLVVEALADRWGIEQLDGGGGGGGKVVWFELTVHTLRDR